MRPGPVVCGSGVGVVAHGLAIPVQGLRQLQSAGVAAYDLDQSTVPLGSVALGGWLQFTRLQHPLHQRLAVRRPEPVEPYRLRRQALRGLPSWRRRPRPSSNGRPGIPDEMG